MRTTSFLLLLLHLPLTIFSCQLTPPTLAILVAAGPAQEQIVTASLVRNYFPKAENLYTRNHSISPSLAPTMALPRSSTRGTSSCPLLQQPQRRMTRRQSPDVRRPRGAG